MNQPRKVITFDIDEHGLLGVHAISVVERPAMEEMFVALSDVKMSAVDSERRMIYGAILVPDKEILRIDPKTNEEYFVKFPKDVVMKVAHGYLTKNQHHNATYEHAVEVDGMTLVESWLKEGEADKSVQLGLNAELPDFTWFGGMYVTNDEVWEKVKAGEVKGFSIEGRFAELSEQMMSVNAMLAEIEEIIKSHAQ
jgi:hypothetical protein